MKSPDLTPLDIPRLRIIDKKIEDEAEIPDDL
jgi:hypothetical protein